MGDKKSATDSDLEGVLDYKLKIDFSKLVDVLKECRSRAQENAGDIAALRASLELVREEKENVQSQMLECTTTVDRMTVLFFPLIL